jgi:homoserine dehydrogenase
MEFDDALKLAQELGFAERNPAADVEGHDACRKICILASLASGKHVYPKGIHTEGITNISLNDVKYASSFNSVIKLIGDVKFLENGKLDIFVAPMIVNRHSQLANIDNEFNGIMVRGDCTDDVVFYGKGAGSLPTASAVVADIIDCCKHLKARKYLFWADSNNENVLPYNESVTAVYLRFSTDDKEASIAEVRDLFGDIVQLSITNESENEFAVVTKTMTIGKINDKLNQVKKSKLLSNIRIADL